MATLKAAHEWCHRVVSEMEGTSVATPGKEGQEVNINPETEPSM